ncbi:hypothetical protein M089_3892 [Bacteroides ovatus str. 3725 D9 iii]|nr:hypothetical protein M089_3892 [Bacteroides ovatus str. 3725 D9 iii]
MKRWNNGILLLMMRKSAIDKKCGEKRKEVLPKSYIRNFWGALLFILFGSCFVSI